MTEIDMTGLLLKLANLGITGIKVHYEGSGDSGAIESISYTTEPCETPDDVDEHAESWDPDKNLGDLVSTGDYAIIEDFVYNLLEDVEDWYNNEGGFGDMSICIPSGQYIIDNHVRYYNTQDYQHEGNLIQKSVE